MTDARELNRSLRRHAMAGGLAGLLLFGGVGGWATATSISGAVVALGTLVVESDVKQVQHPEGGVVGELVVQEGDRVAAGDVVLRLDATQTRAGLAIVVKQLHELLARQARLEAERDDLDAIVFADELLTRRDDATVSRSMASEESLFRFRAQARLGLKAQLGERIAQYRSEIEGLEAQQDAVERGLAALDLEIEGLQSLYARNLVSMQRLNTLEREAAALQGERAVAIASQARVAGHIAETELQILQVDIDLKTEVGTELREVQAQIGEFSERRIAAEDTLRRVDIVAPQDGIVHELAVHTVGGVIGGGQVLMLIVPEGERLALDVQVSPRDIDQVHLGQEANIRLSAFNQRTTPELQGKVSRLAADQTIDERTGAAFYRLRIDIPRAQLDRLGELVLMPGMPAEAFIRTGERTVLSYLVKPLADQLNRAFRED